MGLFDITQNNADILYGWFNISLIIGSVLALVGTIGAILMSGVRDRFADERFSKNEVEIAMADEKAATAQANAAKANERAESIRKINLELQKRLEAERIERLRLEASIAPRQLSEQQRTTLVRLLIASQPLQIHFTEIGDQEAGHYGRLILAALEDAGVKIAATHIGIMAPPRYGVVLILSRGNPKAFAIKNAFEVARIPVESSFSDINEFDAKVFVGLRPLGPN